MDENLKKNFLQLFKYQEKDRELRKLNAFINHDDALVAMNRSKKAFNDAKQILSDSEVQAGSIIESFAELSKYIEENEKLVTELENTEPENEEDLAERVKKLESLKSKFTNAEKKAHDLADRAKDVCRSHVEAIKTGKTAKQKYAESKEKHAALVNSRAEEKNKLVHELEALGKDIDPKLFEEYRKLDEDNKFPPVVKASGDDKSGYNCGGCGLSLPQQGNALLKDKGYCRCENCRRIIVHIN